MSALSLLGQRQQLLLTALLRPREGLTIERIISLPRRLVKCCKLTSC